jgi:hypothetical protein
VQDVYTQKLGIAAEEQAQKGMENYNNLYQTYGRFAPNITPMDLMPYGGLQTGQSIQNMQFNAGQELQANLAEVQAMLGGVTMESSMVGPTIGPSVMGPYQVSAAGSLGNAAVGEGIASGVSGILGAYGANQMMQQYGQQGLSYGGTVGARQPGMYGADPSATGPYNVRGDRPYQGALGGYYATSGSGRGGFGLYNPYPQRGGYNYMGG